MNRNLYAAIFGIGALAVVWIGIGFAGTNLVALGMTAVIGAVYVFGARELQRYREATGSLSTALAAIPEPLPELGPWLDRLHPSLQNAVRLRIEGERIGLPAPALTPYLVGLLVMLGMLGTFIGMVVTFNGALFTLDGATDLAAIRASLAGPIKGLGLAFGTSVAGVAASAMLGLMSALVRRERATAAQLLDAKIATTLRNFSLTHQRQETFKALQAQAGALPAVVEQLQALMATLERQHSQFGERLAGNQEDFHREIKAVYSELAGSVDRSLKESLTQTARSAEESLSKTAQTADQTLTRTVRAAEEALTRTARAAGESIQPVAEAALAGIAREAREQHERLVATTQSQLETLSGRLEASAERAAAAWSTAAARQESSNTAQAGQLKDTLVGFAETFEQRSANLLKSVETTLSERQAAQAAAEQQRIAAWQESLNAVEATLAERQAAQALAEQQRLSAWTGSLETMATSLKQEWQQAGAATLAQQQQICATLEQTAQEITAQAQANASRTIDEITVLLQTAAEAPRAAAEVIGQLREELSNSMARDNALLDERARIMATLSSLLDAINHASAEQRATIDALVANSEDLLKRAGSQFAEQVGAESTRLVELGAQVAGSAVEVSSLGESFGFAVQRFSESSDSLIANLQRIEAAMDKSLSRSDDQLAYYVAQAREIIDLSIMSQKEVVDDLRRLTGRPSALDEAVS